LVVYYNNNKFFDFDANVFAFLFARFESAREKERKITFFGILR
jgi:hypothetical protein